MNNLTIFGEDIIQEKVIEQLKNCFIDESDIGVLTPDAHYGYAHPIGGAIAYKNHISISGVGFDIGCGNKAVKTNIKVEDINVSNIMDEIFKRISFGVGRINNEKVDHEVLDLINKADVIEQRGLFVLASTQLGTIGSGNHFIDLFKGNDGYLWIGVHFGSRGFGHKTATGFMALAKGLKFHEKVSEGSMDSKPILLDLNTDLGQSYFSAMELAGKYAMAGRDLAVNKVLEILQAQIVFEVHNHHNFAWNEIHNDEKYCVVRKGCTPAFNNQYGFVGANMQDNSVIIKGVNSEDSKKALYSTVHGAGRIMSRTEAVGKKKWIKNEEGRKVPTIISKGKVDFDKVKYDIKATNIELRGAGADEAPECYKNLKEVLGYMKNNIEIVEELIPVGVAMAGNDEYDPYKD